MTETNLGDLFDSRHAAVRAVIEIPADHHARCATRSGGECDCFWRRYEPQRQAIKALDSLAADAALVERYRAALQEIAAYVEMRGRPVLAIMAREALR